MRQCKNCKTDISKRGNRATRCVSCQKKYRNFIKHISGTGRKNKQCYQLWKFLNENSFTRQELEMLFLKRKKECKYVRGKERLALKTEMMIINRKVKYIDCEEQDD